MVTLKMEHDNSMLCNFSNSTVFIDEYFIWNLGVSLLVM